MSQSFSYTPLYSCDPEVDYFVSAAVWATVSGPYSRWPGAETMTAPQIITLALEGYGARALDLQNITVH
jgi:hypothetical protein